MTEQKYEFLTRPRNVSVGSVVILRDSRKGTFRRVNVTKVTKTGRFYVEESPVLFRESGEPVERKAITHLECVENTDKNWVQLEWREESDKKRRAERKAADDERHAAYEARMAEELAAVKAACGEEGLNVLQHFTAPDGNEVYTVRIPVMEAYVERKKGWEIMTVRIGPPTTDWMGRTSRECAMTVCNGSSGSFGSYSTSNADPNDPEKALWDCARQAYHSW